MHKISWIAKALGFLLATTIIGGLLAYLLFYIFEFGIPSGEWRQVNFGQEKATRILGGDLSSATVYIQTSQENIYVCQETYCLKTTTPHLSQARFEETLYSSPKPPGDVSESFVGPGPMHGLCTGQTNFVILTDGSIWTWSKSGCCEIGCLLNLVYPLVGLVLGFTTGIVILIVRQRKRR
jgi:hypothetical protein